MKNNIANPTDHNLCSNFTPPPNIRDLLRLGLKFCILHRKLHSSTLSTSMERFRRDIRLRFFFDSNHEGNSSDMESPHKKKLYIKSDWQPPYTLKPVEQRLTSFEKEISYFRHKLRTTIPPATNLTAPQEYALKFLKNHKDLIVLMADKNLGPVLMERKVYISETL